jgi:Ni/Fe-hydrogenase b-type cytochrome subunit
MKTTTDSDSGIHILLGPPVPFGMVKARDLLAATALASRAGTDDPVDLALLGAASHNEDLRHFQQHEFSPPTPEYPHSISSIRHLDTGREELIARGTLESILTLCRLSEYELFQARLQSSRYEGDGYKIIAVAHCAGEQHGKDAPWEFLGFVPVRATSHKPRYSEAPQAFRYVVVWDWQLRFLHWAAALTILTLCITGWMIGSSQVTSGRPGDPFFIGYVRLIHFSAGGLLAAMGILRIAGLFLASTKYQHWRALFPVSIRDLTNLYRVGKNYLLCIFDHGPHYIGHNPLQQVAYTGIYLMALLAILTGFSLYGMYDAHHWLFRHFLWLNHLVGAQYVRLVHLFMMWVFMAFMPIHIYLAIRADTVEREGAISSIFSGGRWCRKGTVFEDQ